MLACWASRGDGRPVRAVSSTVAQSGHIEDSPVSSKLGVWMVLVCFTFFQGVFAWEVFLFLIHAHLELGPSHDRFKLGRLALRPSGSSGHWTFGETGRFNSTKALRAWHRIAQRQKSKDSLFWGGGQISYSPFHHVN